MEKLCKYCNIIKSLENFSKHTKTKDGLQQKCKTCVNLHNKEYREKNKDILNEKQKIFYLNNKITIKENKKIIYQNNSEIIKFKTSEYYKLHKNEYNIYHKKYRNLNKTKLNEYNKNYMKNKRTLDELYKLKGNIRSKISDAFRKNGYTKKSKTIEIIGCSFEEFKLYLESKFKSWMTWDNYGLYNGELNYGWDIDHIIPLASATCEADIIKLNHFSNLQPLCSHTNRNIKKDLINK